MHWHLAPTVYTLRGYTQPNGFAQHAPFVATGQVLIVGDLAVVWGLLGSSANPITLRDRAAIAALLRELGVQMVMADRHGRVVQMAG
jgi:hypothetical protein